jgi:hypothetical protein
MATATQIRNKADIKLGEIWDFLSAKQETYYRNKGKYIQLLASNNVVDGVDTTVVVRLPSDEPHVIDAGMIFPTQVPFQLTVDAWGNNEAQGYTVTVIIELLDGRRFTRSRALTDTRKRVEDVDFTDPENPIALGTYQLIGDVPSLVSTDWQEIIIGEII